MGFVKLISWLCAECGDFSCIFFYLKMEWIFLLIYWTAFYFWIRVWVFLFPFRLYVCGFIWMGVFEGGKCFCMRECGFNFLSKWFFIFYFWVYFSFFVRLKRQWWATKKRRGVHFVQRRWIGRISNLSLANVVIRFDYFYITFIFSGFLLMFYMALND